MYLQDTLESMQNNIEIVPLTSTQDSSILIFVSPIECQSFRYRTRIDIIHFHILWI